MYRYANLGCLVVGAGLLLVSIGVHAYAGEADPLKPDFSLNHRGRDEFGNTNYRYDFSERHLTFGMDLGAALPQGNTLNAFPLGGLVTPYFRGAFGDGNAVEFALTFGALLPSGTEADWLFFRTPIEEGGTVSGHLGFLAPVVTFRYEIGLTASISHRARVLTWGGIGFGPAFTSGEVTMTGNGTQPDKTVTNYEVFFDVVPTWGFKLRLTEFAFLQLGARFHLLWVIGAKVTGEDQMTYGSPEVIQEFWIGNSKIIDAFLGFGYDFG